MKTDHNMIKKTLSASLSIVYFFIALTYIQFLPNYTARRLNSHHASHLVAGAYGTGNGSHAVLQKFFKSTPENKRDLATDLLNIAALMGLLVAAVFVASRLILLLTNSSLHAITQRRVYLQYRSLRI